MVVNLAIENYLQSQFRIAHRLVSANSEVENGQATEPKSEAGIGLFVQSRIKGTDLRGRIFATVESSFAGFTPTEEIALVIRSAVFDRVGHFPQKPDVGAFILIQTKDSADSTHNKVTDI